MTSKLLVEMIASGAIAPGRTLEVGCGTGTNAIYLAEHGFEIVGVEISSRAVDIARARAQARPSISSATRRPAGRSISCSIAAAFMSSMTIASARASRSRWPASSSRAAALELPRRARSGQLLHTHARLPGAEAVVAAWQLQASAEHRR